MIRLDKGVNVNSFVDKFFLGLYMFIRVFNILYEVRIRKFVWKRDVEKEILNSSNVEFFFEFKC